MFTEEEAKTKWCPFVKVSGNDFWGWRFNRPKGTGSGCFASACMAWRWVDGPNDDVDGDPRLDGRLAKAVGYCGLAGKP